MLNIIAEDNLLKELQNNFNKNIYLLQKIYPDLFKRLKESENKTDEEHFIVKIHNGVKIVSNYTNTNLWIPVPEKEQLKLNKDEKKLFEDKRIIIAGLSTGFNLFKAKSIPIPVTILRLPKDIRPEAPIYVIEEEISIFNLCLYLYDLEEIITDSRFIFFIGNKAIDEFKEHISNDKILIPRIILSSKPTFKEGIKDKIKNCLNEVKKEKEENFKKIISEVISYYNSKGLEYYKNRFKERDNLRILILTSRFTTYVKYVMRSMKDAFSSLGCEVTLLCEESNIETVYTDSSLAKNINALKPDLIFVISRLRGEFPAIPKNIPFVTWVQDMLPDLTNKNNIEKIDKFDIVIGYPNLLNYGYKEENLYYSILNILSNTDIYHKMQLSNDDKEKYTCDVAYVSNHSYTPEQALSELKTILKQFDEILPIIDLIYQKVKKSFKKGKILWAQYQYEEITREAEAYLKTEIRNTNLREFIINTFYNHIGAKLFRQKPLIWLKEIADINLKLYGNGWETHPQLSCYAQGFVEPGEELCKVFNATKINLQLGYSPFDWRVYDCLASGGFILINYTPLCEADINYYEELLRILSKTNNEKSINKIAANFNNPIHASIFRAHCCIFYNKINDEILKIDELDKMKKIINLWLEENRNCMQFFDLISYNNLPQIYFKNKDELIQKVKYYLKNEDEREEIANKLSRFFRENFSHIKFCENVLDVVSHHFSNLYGQV